MSRRPRRAGAPGWRHERRLEALTRLPAVAVTATLAGRRRMKVCCSCLQAASIAPLRTALGGATPCQSVHLAHASVSCLFIQGHTQPGALRPCASLSTSLDNCAGRSVVVRMPSLDPADAHCSCTEAKTAPLTLQVCSCWLLPVAGRAVNDALWARAWICSTSLQVPLAGLRWQSEW